MSRTKYNKEDCFKLFLTCKTISEFMQKYSACYSACFRLGWMKEFVIKSGIKKLKNTYSIEECLKFASTCKSKIEFSKKYKSAYQFATKKSG